MPKERTVSEDAQEGQQPAEAPAAEPAADDALVAEARRSLARAGLADVAVARLDEHAEGGAMLAFRTSSHDAALSAASEAIRRASDGHEWRFAGSGAELDRATGRPVGHVALVRVR